MSYQPLPSVTFDANNGNDAPVPVPLLIAAQLVWDASLSKFIAQRPAKNISDAAQLGTPPPAPLWLWNGATWDRMRSNTETIFLASGSRTTTQNSGDITNYNARGITVVLDMTDVSAGPSVTLQIQGKDSASGKYVNLVVSTPITTVSTNVLRVIPGVPVAANQAQSLPLPRVLRLLVTANNANAGIYSAGYNLHV